MAARINRTSELCKHGIVWFVLLLAFAPFYLMLVISFKSNRQFVSNPWFFDGVHTWHWENWAKGWFVVRDYIANSIVTSSGAVLLCLVMAVPTSYVLARYRFLGRNLVYYGLIASMFLPATAATLVTLYSLLRQLELTNNLLALVIVHGVGGQVVCVFILRLFVEDIPREMFESAQIDGAGHLQQIRHIVLPMSAPILGTLAILTFLAAWNDLMLPLVIMRDNELLTVPVGLMRLDGEYVKQWGEMMAAYAISSIPLVLLFLFTMRFFVQGLSAGAIKG